MNDETNITDDDVRQAIDLYTTNLFELGLFGNSFWKIERDYNGDPIALEWLNPQLVGYSDNGTDQVYVAFDKLRH